MTAVRRGGRYDGDRSADGIAILRQRVDQFLARSSGMARPSARQLRPVVQQAVAIHKNADQGHRSNASGEVAKWEMQILLLNSPLEQEEPT